MHRFFPYYLLYLVCHFFLIFFRSVFLNITGFFILVTVDSLIQSHTYFIQKFLFFSFLFFIIIDGAYQLIKKKKQFTKKSFYHFSETTFSLDFKLYNANHETKFKKKVDSKKISKLVEHFKLTPFWLLIKRQAIALFFLFHFIFVIGWGFPQIYKSVFDNISLFFQEYKYNYTLFYDKQVKVGDGTTIEYQGNYESAKIIFYKTNELNEDNHEIYEGSNSLQVTLNNLEKDIIFEINLKKKKLIKKKKYKITVVDNPILISNRIEWIDNDKKKHLHNDIQYIKVNDIKSINLKAIYNPRQKIKEVMFFVNGSENLPPKIIKNNFFSIEIDLDYLPFDFDGNVHWQVKNQYDLWSEKYSIYFDLPKKKTPVVNIEYPFEKFSFSKLTNLNVLAKVFSETKLKEVSLVLKTSLEQYQQKIEIKKNLKKSKSFKTEVNQNYYFVEDQFDFENIKFLPSMKVNYHLVVKNEQNLIGYSKTNTLYYLTDSEQSSMKLEKKEWIKDSLLEQSKENEFENQIDKMELALEKKNWKQAKFYQKELYQNVTNLEQNLQSMQSKFSEQASSVEDQFYYKKLQKIISEIDRLDQSLIEMLKNNLSSENNNIANHNIENKLDVLKKAKDLKDEMEYLEKQIEYIRHLEKIQEYYKLANGVYENLLSIKLDILKNNNMSVNENDFINYTSYSFQKKAIEIDYNYLKREYQSNYLDLLNDFRSYQHLINKIDLSFKKKITFLSKKKSKIRDLNYFLDHQEKIVNDFVALLNAFVTDSLTFIMEEIVRQIESFSIFNDWQEGYQGYMTTFDLRGIGISTTEKEFRQHALLTYVNEVKSQTKYFRNELYTKTIGKMTNMITFLYYYEENVKWFDLVQRYYDPANSKNNLKTVLKELKNIFPTKEKEELKSIHYGHTHNITPFLEGIKSRNNQILYKLIILKDWLSKQQESLQESQNQLSSQQQDLNNLLQQFRQSISKENRQPNQRYSQALKNEIFKKINNYEKSLEQANAKKDSSKDRKNNLNSQKYVEEIKKDLAELKASLNDKAKHHKIDKIIKKFSNNLAKANHSKHAINKRKKLNNQNKEYQAQKAKKYKSKLKSEEEAQYFLNNKKSGLEEVINYPDEYLEKIDFFLQYAK